MRMEGFARDQRPALIVDREMSYFLSARGSLVPAKASFLNMSVFSNCLSSRICCKSSSSMKSSGLWIFEALLLREDLKVDGAHPV